MVNTSGWPLLDRGRRPEKLGLTPSALAALSVMQMRRRSSCPARWAREPKRNAAGTSLPATSLTKTRRRYASDPPVGRFGKSTALLSAGAYLRVIDARGMPITRTEFGFISVSSRGNTSVSRKYMGPKVQRRAWIATRKSFPTVHSSKPRRFQPVRTATASSHSFTIVFVGSRDGMCRPSPQPPSPPASTIPASDQPPRAPARAPFPAR